MKRRRTPSPWAQGLAAMALAAGCAVAPGGVAYAGTAAAYGGAGRITAGSACLDGSGSSVQLAACDGLSAQAWTWRSDGGVAAAGQCLESPGGSTADGTLVERDACAPGAAGQRFSYLPDGTIYAAESGKCLAVQGSSSAGAMVGLAPCDPTQAGQKWTAVSAPGAAYDLSAAKPVAFSNVDDTPAAVFLDRTGKFYYQQSHSLYGKSDSRQWSFYSGRDFDTAELDPISSAVNPAHPQDRNDDTTWRCDTGPTGKEATPAPSGSGYSQRNYCDLLGTWVDPDTGNWYGLVHNEFTPQPFGDGLHYDAVDYAVSRDQGHTWTIQGHVITSPYSTSRDDTAHYPQQTYYYGDGDQRLFVDDRTGYFYAFYATRVLNKADDKPIWEEHVARAPISRKMAPASWQKWYDGAWQSPGVGGRESDIIPSDGGGSGYIPSGKDYNPSNPGTVRDQVGKGTMPSHSQLAVLNVTWSAYLGEYIGTPQNNIAQDTNTKTPLHFYATKDLATQKWTDMGSVASLPNAAWYRWFLDAESLTSSTVVGKTFRSYCAYYCSTSDGEYADVTIAPKTAADLPQVPVRGGATYTIGASNGQRLAQSGTALTSTARGGSASPAQKWRFTGTGDGFFTVTNAGSGQALGVSTTGDAGRAWGAEAMLSKLAKSPSAGQEWSIQQVMSSPADGGPSVATGNYRLVNRYSGLALSLTGQSVATAPQRNWNNAGSAGDGRPAGAQLLAFAS
ncbi:RICIN domain-containing protein [Streptomyces sp. NPDC094438]|uniref:RICIN domain-containing protein n=1 Tax=Streptomyces sp. NPDC094438 TaxID=3366061 RepID=UPI00382D9587